jgi:DNA-binding NarL/FixJ family response regulator
VRVVIADDSLLVREGVARLLIAAGIEVAAEARDADELLDVVAATAPDVAIVDIRMPPTHTDEGLRAALELRRRDASLGVLVLSQYVRPSYAFELLADDARGVGYLLKDRVAHPRELSEAVYRVGEGGSVLDPDVVAQLVDRPRRHDEPIDDLSARERDVLALVAEGRSNRAIAERLSISDRTVEKHVTAILDTLGIAASAEDHRRVLAVLAYLGA